MSRADVLAIALPLLAIGVLALWPSVNLYSKYLDRLQRRETRGRQTLVNAALDTLRDLRASIDEVFRKADEGDDPFLRSADPEDVRGPASKFVRYMELQTSMEVQLVRTSRQLKSLYWFALVFVGLALACVFAGVFIDFLTNSFVWALIIALMISFLAGGLAFVSALSSVRKLDATHGEIGKLDASNTEDAGEEDGVGP